jgi:Rad3-related DNA helicase
VKSLRKRQSVIVDEAHNAEKEILGFADIEISRSRAEGLDLDLPFFQEGQIKEAFDWLESKFLPAGKIEEERLEAEMSMASHDDRDAAIAISRKHDALDKYLCKVRRIKETNPEDWFVYSDEKTGSLFVKPLTAAMFSEELLFNSGKRILMMSATILDKKTFARNLGIDMSQAGFLRLESDFPVENRLIHFYPTGKMSMAHQEHTIPKMLKMLEKILTKHEGEKGIIHCQSYKIQKIVQEHFMNTKHGSRLLVHSSFDRTETIIHHTNSEDPTILLSPSMTEGLDLKDDLSRFQVIIKLPFPYLGDKFIKARMARDPSWYTWQTALTMVQATGRSIRSGDDYAITYVLDSDFSFFLAKANSILPKWWMDSIVYHP